MDNSRLASSAVVFMTADAAGVSAFYRDVLGFRALEHLDKSEPFVALYRGGVEILLVQAKFGAFRPNHEAYGAGFNIYLVVTDVNEDVDALYEEFRAKGARIVHPPVMTDYGNYEFVLEDPEGRWIGCGHIQKPEVYFR